MRENCGTVGPETQSFDQSALDCDPNGTVAVLVENAQMQKEVQLVDQL
jgi:hypothetical protein